MPPKQKSQKERKAAKKAQKQEARSPTAGETAARREEVAEFDANGFRRWKVGDTTIIRGINARPELNGERARVEELPSSGTNDRYVVRFLTGGRVEGEAVKVLPEKMMLDTAASTTTSTPGAAASSSSSTSFHQQHGGGGAAFRGTGAFRPDPRVFGGWKCGDDAIVFQLASRPDLNGQRVEVTEDFDPSTAPPNARMTIRIPASQEVVRVKPEKLRKPPDVSDQDWKTQVLRAPDELFQIAKSKFAQGDMVGAASNSYEALLTHKEYGHVKPREWTFTSQKVQDNCKAFFAAGEARAAKSQPQRERLLKIMDGVRVAREQGDMFCVSEKVREKLRLRDTDAWLQELADDLAPFMGEEDDDDDGEMRADREALMRELCRGAELVRAERRGRSHGRGGAPGEDSEEEVETLAPARDPLAVVQKRTKFLDLATVDEFEPEEAFVSLYSGPVSALVWAWQCTLPGFVSMALNDRERNAQAYKRGGHAAPDTSATIHPQLTWIYSLLHAIHAFEQEEEVDGEFVQPVHFQFEDKDETEAIMMKIVGLGALPPNIASEIGSLREEDFTDRDDLGMRGGGRKKVLQDRGGGSRLEGGGSRLGHTVDVTSDGEEVVDVLLGAKKKTVPGGDDRFKMGNIPVLFVKYIHNAKATLNAKKMMKALEKGLLVEDARGNKKMPRVIKVKADSAAEVRVAATMLRRNRALMKNHDKTESGDDCYEFRESVLFPPDKRLLEHLEKTEEDEKCCSCEKVIVAPPPAPVEGEGVEAERTETRTGAPSVREKCTTCKICHIYCSTRCRDRDWPHHERICELATQRQTVLDEIYDPLDDGRPSLTFDVKEARDNSPAVRAMRRDGNHEHMMHVSFSSITGQHRTHNPHEGGDVKNIHGRKEFIFKMQPGGATAQGDWMW